MLLETIHRVLFLLLLFFGQNYLHLHLFKRKKGREKKKACVLRRMYFRCHQLKTNFILLVCPLKKKKLV